MVGRTAIFCVLNSLCRLGVSCCLPLDELQQSGEGNLHPSLFQVINDLKVRVAVSSELLDRFPVRRESRWGLAALRRLLSHSCRRMDGGKNTSRTLRLWFKGEESRYKSRQASIASATFSNLFLVIRGVFANRSRKLSFSHC